MLGPSTVDELSAWWLPLRKAGLAARFLARRPLTRMSGSGAAGGYRTYDLSLTKGVLYR